MIDLQGKVYEFEGILDLVVPVDTLFQEQSLQLALVVLVLVGLEVGRMVVGLYLSTIKPIIFGTLRNDFS